MTTNLEKLPYKKNFPPSWTPLMVSVWPSYIFLVGSVFLAILLSRAFALDWDTYQRMSAEAEGVTTATSVERIVIWTYLSDPWLGLIWGVFVGTAMVLLGNAAKRKRIDDSAERTIRSRSFLREIREREFWFAVLVVVAFVSVNLGGAFVLNVSPKTSIPAHLIPAFLLYRTQKKIYDLAKKKYVAALDSGLITEGSLRPRKAEQISMIVAVILSIALSICFFAFTVYAWSDLGELRDVQLEMAGSTRTAEEALALEEQLERNPDNRDAHLILAWYYANARHEAPDVDRDAMREGYYRHTLWLIQYAPENWTSIHLYPRDGEAYEEARRLWMQNIETRADDPKVLMNAAKFFDNTDAALAEEILRKGQALEPYNPEWSEEINELSLERQQRTAREGAMQKEAEGTTVGAGDE